MLGHHIQGAHQPAPAVPAPPQLQPPPAQNVTRVRPPQLCLVYGKIEETDWEAFAAEWANFKVAGHLQTGREKHQLGSVLGDTYTEVFGRLGDWDQPHKQLLTNRSCLTMQSSSSSRGGISMSIVTNSTR